jgi:hypothetical protein
LRPRRAAAGAPHSGHDEVETSGGYGLYVDYELAGLIEAKSSC